MNIPIILALLAFLGLFSCFKFAQADWQGKHGQAPHDVLCTTSTCFRLSLTPYARLFRYPNWYYGIGYYALVILTTFLDLPLLRYAALIVGTAALCTTVFLVWALIFKLKFFCTYCYVAHATNLLLFLTLVVATTHAA